MLPESELRASDREREAAVTLLGDHLAEGRLDLAEFEERSTRASAATTRGELARLTEDLPPAHPSAEAEPAAAPVSLSKDEYETPTHRTGAAAALRPYARWLTASLVCVTVWAVAYLVTGHPQHFWPGWVIGPWGAYMLLRFARGTDTRR